MYNHSRRPFFRESSNWQIDWRASFPRTESKYPVDFFFEENVEILRQNKSLITPPFSLSKSGVEVNILKLTFSSAAGIFFETFDKSNQSDKDYFPFREISRGYPVTDV